jgi:hypothetical protein
LGLDPFDDSFDCTQFRIQSSRPSAFSGKSFANQSSESLLMTTFSKSK